MAGLASHRRPEAGGGVAMVAKGVVGALACLLLAAQVDAGIDIAFCDLAGQQGASGPKFPSISNTYQAKLEIVRYNDRTTMYVEEYYDLGTKMGSMIVTGYFNPGVRTQFISDGRTNEFFTIYDVDNTYDLAGNCQVDPLTGGIFSFPEYTMGSFSAKSDDFMSSGSILVMGQASDYTYYNGSHRINGIYGDIWRSCLYQKTTDTTVKATFYFSGTTAGAIFPIRIDLESNTKPQGFKRTFNYAYFSDVLQLDDREIVRLFETPEGTICPNRNSTKDLPSVPKAFSFRMETVDPRTKTVTATREWYDYDAKLTRVDFRIAPTNETGDTYPLRLISDYNTGVSYMINRDTEVCTISAIAGGQFDNTFDAAGNVRLRSPSEFFDFDQTSMWPYQYEGVHFARGILADTWISKRPLNAEDPADGPVATWEWYFASAEWRLQANINTEVLEPVRAVLTLQDEHSPTIFNIYKFTEEEPDASYFDISACYLSAESRAYQMSFAADVKKYQLDTTRQLLKYFVLLSIQAYTNVSILRIQELEMTFGNDYFTIQFLLLGPAPNATKDVYQVSLWDAGQALEQGVQSGTFTVYLLYGDQLDLQFQAQPDSLRVIHHRRRPSMYVKGGGGDGDSASGMTDGGLVALLVIGTLVAGAVLSLAAIWLAGRRGAGRSSGGGLPYHRHVVDMDAK